MSNIGQNMSSRAVIMTFLLSAFGCSRIDEPGKVIFSESTEQRYLVLREGRSGYVQSISARAPDRPELEGLREVHGDLKFICTEIHGVDRPRIVVETKNRGRYQVVFQWGDHDALKSIAKPLGLAVAEEEREIACATIRLSQGGHRLKPASPGQIFDFDRVACREDGSWPLDGATLDDLARFLEYRHYRVVVNKTGLEGRWHINLSFQASKKYPRPNAKEILDDLGLELRHENTKVLVTVVKDVGRN
jgi:hypothetical protein